MNSPDVVSVVTEDPGEADLSQLGQLTGPKSCWILVPEPVCVSETIKIAVLSQNITTDINRTVIQIRIIPVNPNLIQYGCIIGRDQFCEKE
jgi:hypothetical protein